MTKIYFLFICTLTCSLMSSQKNIVLKTLSDLNKLKQLHPRDIIVITPENNDLETTHFELEGCHIEKEEYKVGVVYRVFTGTLTIKTQYEKKDHNGQVIINQEGTRSVRVIANDSF